MISRLKEVTMEEIPHITSDTVDKLRKLNINSVYQLAVQTPSELALEISDGLFDTEGDCTLPTVCDKLNLVASIHNRKLTAALTKEMREKDVKIKQLSDKVIELENTMKMIMDKLRMADSDLSLPS
jgi:hypothetical protein